MSTNSFSVISLLQDTFGHYAEVKDGSIEVSESGHRMELEYDGHDYDITVTKLVPGCGELMDFGQAIRCLNKGLKVARKGWNGKGMFLWLKPATRVKVEWTHDPVLRRICEANGGEIDAYGTICMKTADNKIVSGWLASQADLLCEDWEVVQ